MNARRLIVTVSVLLVTWSAVEAASVSWIEGTTSPTKWAIEPSNPGTSDTITFSGPTRVYSNSCEAERSLGGTPQLSVDSVSRVITLWFQGPVPSVCTADYRPVAGLEGDFGPLPAGDWTFVSLSRELNFEIRFTVAGKVTHHVDGDAPGPLHDGKTWATAFLTLQDGLAAAAGGDEIVVAEGTYTPDRGDGIALGDRQASFVLKDGLTVKGGFAGYGQPDPDAQDVNANRTVLSGDLEGNDLWRLLNRDDNSYHVVTGSEGTAGATLDGLFIVNGNADGMFPNELGGGLYNPGGALKVVNCTLEGNSAAFGGGILNLGAEITLVNTQLIGNRAFLSGGGLYNWEGSATLHNCRVVGNSADRAAEMGGSAVDNLTGSLTVLDSTIADNLSPNGGAIHSFSWDSHAGGAVRIVNSILYNGGREVLSDDMAAVSISYSDVQGGSLDAGNINAAPLFVAPGGWSIEGEWIDGDYHLQATSPCIDAGNDADVPADVADLDGDDDVAEPLPVDLGGTTRIQGSRVDMGAYEQLASKPVPGFAGELTFLFTGNGRQGVLTVDSVYPDTFTGSLTLGVETTVKLQLVVDVIATSSAGGRWTGWTVPDTVSPPSGTVTLWVKGEGLNLTALPSDAKSVQVAEAELSAILVP
ncbi:MAG: hypothetical protein JW955_09380 [Sedimentisphaerales bacterium]|nr:hypothetical protein [Sedimentisphaerales bacterium]